MLQMYKLVLITTVQQVHPVITSNTQSSSLTAFHYARTMTSSFFIALLQLL